MSVIEQLAQFIENCSSRLPQSQWLHDKTMKVYVRHGYHLLDGEPHWCLDIASVTAQQQGRGTWTKFIAEVQRINPWDAVYVECVHNERFQDWFVRNGWSKIDQGGAPSFFLLKGLPCSLP